MSDTFTCPIVGPLVPLFWISGNVSSGFQSQSGFCFIHIAEANVMYISWDPPLVKHIANLLMDSIAGQRLGSYLGQGYYCVAAVSLKPAINRLWVLRANHSATHPGQFVLFNLIFFELKGKLYIRTLNSPKCLIPMLKLTRIVDPQLTHLTYNSWNPSHSRKTEASLKPGANVTCLYKLSRWFI